MSKILLCTDMDRTLLPNGDASVSPMALPLFEQLVNHPDIILAYVTGRDLGLVQQAVRDYQVPEPDFIIGDVGASIYYKAQTGYLPLKAWQQQLHQDWQGHDSRAVALALGPFDRLELQAAAKQSRYKLSYQIAPSCLMPQELEVLQQRLANLPIRANLIASIDETLDQGLVDLLPAQANKRKAIEFLFRWLDLEPQQLFFSGDSGNDVEMLQSPYFATLVANATDEVRQRLQRSETLYMAQGLPEWQLNGNYCGGIVEGFLHYFPHAQHWLKTELTHEC